MNDDASLQRFKRIRDIDLIDVQNIDMSLSADYKYVQFVINLNNIRDDAGNLKFNRIGAKVNNWMRSSLIDLDSYGDNLSGMTSILGTNSMYEPIPGLAIIQISINASNYNTGDRKKIRLALFKDYIDSSQGTIKKLIKEKYRNLIDGTNFENRKFDMPAIPTKPVISNVDVTDDVLSFTVTYSGNINAYANAATLSNPINDWVGGNLYAMMNDNTMTVINNGDGTYTCSYQITTYKDGLSAESIIYDDTYKIHYMVENADTTIAPNYNPNYPDRIWVSDNFDSVISEASVIVPTPHFTMTAMSGSFVDDVNTANKLVHGTLGSSTGQIIQDTILNGTTSNVWSATAYSYTITTDGGTGSIPSYSLNVILKNQDALGNDYTGEGDVIMSFNQTNMYNAILVKMNTDSTISLMYATKGTPIGTYTTLGTSTDTFNDQYYNMITMTRSLDRLTYKVYLNGSLQITHVFANYDDIPVTNGASDPAMIEYAYHRDLVSAIGLYNILEISQYAELLTDSEISALYTEALTSYVVTGNEIYLTQDFSSAGTSEITYQLAGISIDKAFSSPNERGQGTYQHDHDSTIPAGNYKLIYSVADFDNINSTPGAIGFGMIEFIIKDASGNKVNDVFDNCSIISQSTGATINSGKLPNMLKVEWGSVQNLDNHIEIECDCTIPSTGDYKFEIVITCGDGSGSNNRVNCNYNVELRPV